jgi:hypothetical protein
MKQGYLSCILGDDGGVRSNVNAVRFIIFVDEAHHKKW